MEDGFWSEFRNLGDAYPKENDTPPFQVINKVDIAVGERLRQRRENLGVTVEKLASKCLISPTTIFAYESGEIRVTPSNLIKFSEVLYTELSYFFGFA